MGIVQFIRVVLDFDDQINPKILYFCKMSLLNNKNYYSNQ